MKKTILVVMDGWGDAPASDANAISRANTPHFNFISEHFSRGEMLTSGLSVGLPEGQMGNSEVGHLNLGAGRIVYQDLTRINLAIGDGSFNKNKILIENFKTIQAAGGALHLIGLVSDGGVHSHIDHIEATLKLARECGIGQTYLHAIMDGRDCSPTGGERYLSRLVDFMKTLAYGRIATVVGRFYAMDRDTRWERVKVGYEAMVKGVGTMTVDPVRSIQDQYSKGITDEFLPPFCVEDTGRIGDKDGIFFFNFRADRARELTNALTLDGFEGFDRGAKPVLSAFVTMTMFDESYTFPIAFPSEELHNILGEVISTNGLSQLRIAETEKYAHVTYFFNGGIEKVFAGEDRILIPSPKEVRTYDLKPQMSAALVTDALVAAMRTSRYSFIIVNFANSDMVGHTGNIPAAIMAVEAVDAALGKVYEAAVETGYVMIVTADHGNADKMLEADGAPCTSHTINPVPLIIVDYEYAEGVGAIKKIGGTSILPTLHALPKEVIIADIAPTILHFLGIPNPSEMTGKSLC